MDIWKEGKYVDLWSVNHFLSGICFAGWMLWIGFGMSVVFSLYLVFAVGWEFFESWKGIKEYFGNKVTDVVAGLLGVIAINLVQVTPFWLVVFTIVYLLMEFYGYITYKRIGKIGSNIIH